MVVVNSHDRTTPVRFSLGWHEGICSNGMIILREGCNFRLRHIGITTAKIVEIVAKLVQQFPKIAADRERYQKIQLTYNDALSFAKDAASIRFPEDVKINLDNLVAYKYDEQADWSLWNIFNNVQRNLIAGGFDSTYTTDKGLKTRKVRRINSIDMDMDVNGRLWQLLEVYANKSEVTNE